MRGSGFAESYVFVIRLIFTLAVTTVGAEMARASDSEGAPPIADAGPSRYVSGVRVRLDGTGSYDPDNSGSLSYTWRQLSGPPLQLPGTGEPANSATLTVRGIVQTDEIQECEFELVVSDGELTSRPDTVKIIIVPDYGQRELRLENDSFDPTKPTHIYFGGGYCGDVGLPTSSLSRPEWLSRANIIDFPDGYEPDSDTTSTYYKYGDLIVAYLSAVAPEYKQPIQISGHSAGGQPAIDVGIHMNLTYQDPRYAINRVTLLDVACRDYSEIGGISTFLASSVDGEQCWVDNYIGIHVIPTYFYRGALNIASSLGHSSVRDWYWDSLTDDDMNKFNDGIVAGAYLSVMGLGKNLQLASTPDTMTYAFEWHGTASSGYMRFYDESDYPGRLPEPVALVGPPDGAVVDANGAVLGCEFSENAVGYRLLLGSDPYRVMDYTVVSDTVEPPSQLITDFPCEQTFWTVRVYDEYGSTIHADPRRVYAESVSTQTVENAMTGQRYTSVQQAINDAHSGDEIVVSPRAYQYLENIRLEGKNLTIRSVDPNDPRVVASTVIDGGLYGSVIDFFGSKGPRCVLAGLTITNGTTGVSCCGASPTIRNCTIEGNGSAAIEYWAGYSPSIIGCTVLGKVVDVNDPRAIAHWELDEGEGIVAHDRIGEFDGTLNGEPVWQPDRGILDGALLFDGDDDYISTPIVLNPYFSPFSVFTWIQTDVPGTVILSQRYSSNWLLTDSTGRFITELKTSGTSAHTLVSEATVTDGNWHRIGLVRDGKKRRLFVDDVEVASDRHDYLASWSSGLYIGAGKQAEPDSFFSGLIDDVQIYNSAIIP